MIMRIMMMMMMTLMIFVQGYFRFEDMRILNEDEVSELQSWKQICLVQML